MCCSASKRLAGDSSRFSLLNCDYWWTVWACLLLASAIWVKHLPDWTRWMFNTMHSTLPIIPQTPLQILYWVWKLFHLKSWNISSSITVDCMCSDHSWTLDGDHCATEAAILIHVMYVMVRDNDRLPMWSASKSLSLRLFQRAEQVCSEFLPLFVDKMENFLFPYHTVSARHPALIKLLWQRIPMSK